MSSIVSDPTALTKDKLKRELTKFDVDLPSSDAKKGVYVELYREHVLNQTSEFSADEEVSPKLSKKKLPKKKSSKKMASSGVDVTSLSDKELASMLRDMGVDMGPILPSTRKVYQKKLEKLLASAGEPAPASSQSSSQDTIPVEDIDFSADSDPEQEEPPVVIPPQFDNVRRRQTRPEPPPSPPRKSKVAPPPSPPRRQKVVPPPSPPRQMSHMMAPRTPPKLPQDARLVRPPISQQRPVSSKSRTYDQTDGRTVSTGAKKKGWLSSVWLQLLLLLLVGLVIFFVIQNMEPASKDPLKGLEREVP